MSSCELPLPKIFRRPHWKIDWLDIVELKRDICKWPAGTRGTVLGDEGRLKVIEISDDEGRPLVFLVVPERELELVAHNIWSRVLLDTPATAAIGHGASKLGKISDDQRPNLELVEHFPS
jgi:hypothetical protein